MHSSFSADHWALWDILLRLGTAEICDAELAGVENVPDFPRTPLGGGRAAIGRLVRLGVMDRGEAPGPLDVLEQEVDTGAVVAIATGDRDIAVLGGRLAARALASGAVGVVTDGRVRDRDDLGKLPLTVWAAGTTPVAGGLPGTYRRTKGPSRLFGIEWDDGDWYAQDADGALRISAEAVGAVLRRFQKDFRT